MKFCSTYYNSPTPPFPLSETLICLYVVYLANEGLAHSSYLSALRHLQISDGFPDPNISSMPRLSQVIRGKKLQQAKQGHQPRPRLPITPTILHQLRSTWTHAAGDFDHIMLWAWCVGEITVSFQGTYDPTVHLFFNDIAVDNPTNPTIMEVRSRPQKLTHLGEAPAYTWATLTTICAQSQQCWQSGEATMVHSFT